MKKVVDFAGYKAKLITVQTKDLKVELLNYGACVRNLFVKDKTLQFKSVVLSYDNLDDYYNDGECFGKVCGPVAGRIKDGQFTVNYKTYKLPTDAQQNNLHSAPNGFDKTFFDVYVLENDSRVDVHFFTTYSRQDYPGNLSVSIDYYIYKTKPEIEIKYNTTTDKDTLCNMTNHTYFNLSGNCKYQVLDEYLQINASKYGKVNDKMIIESLESSSVMDFTTPKQIKKDILDPSLELSVASGIDHYFLFDKQSYEIPNVILEDKQSNIKLSIYTTNPGVVVYTYNYPNKKNLLFGKNIKNTAIALECQHLPNGINMNLHDKSILKHNDSYTEYVKWVFEV